MYYRTDRLYDFLTEEVEAALLGRFQQGVKNEAPRSSLDAEFRVLLTCLSMQDDMVVVLTDKTNRKIPVSLQWYISQVEQCIAVEAVEIDRVYLVGLLKDGRSKLAAASTWNRSFTFFPLKVCATINILVHVRLWRPRTVNWAQYM